MLWRALKDIEKGFYIDIGAWYPDVDSVTKAFYENDWSGINVEPNRNLFLLLADDRPRDVNLQLAVSDQAGVQDMNMIDNSGLSTFNDEIASEHEAHGWNRSRNRVSCSTLPDIWKQYVPESQEVHFLKIDVEGHEKNVIAGTDWQKFRPWIVVVEATLPMTQIEVHEEWEPILLEGGYTHVYSDGLNRFYLAEEHSDLADRFKYPPNIFDDFVQARFHGIQAEQERMQAERDALRNEIDALRSSRSWKVTRPMRAAMGLVRGFFRMNGRKA